MHGGVSCKPSCTFDVHLAVRTTGETVCCYIPKKVLSITSASCQSFCTQHHESTPQIIDLRQKKAFPTSNSCKLQPLFIKQKEVSKKETCQNSEQKKAQQKKLAISRFPADSLLWHQEHPQQKPFRLAPKKCQMLLYSWQTCLSFQLTLDNGK